MFGTNKIVCAFVLFTLLLALFTVSCKSYYDLYTTNIAHLYKQEDVNFRPILALTKETDSSIYLNYSISASQLNYFKLNELGLYNYSLIINYIIYDYDSRKIIDSLTVYVNDSIESISFSQIANKINIFASNDDFRARVVFTDILSNNSYSQYFDVNKHKLRGTYYNLYENGTPNFDNIVRLNSNIEIENKYNSDGEFVVEYFNNDKFDIALPPHSGSQKIIPNHLKYDSTFTIQQNKKTNIFEFKPSNKGIYKVYLDKVKNMYLSIFCFSATYPEISTVEEMTASLRYITSKREFDNLNQADDLKNKIDTFWISNAGNKDRAKELIKRYYTGVQNANRLFSSYKEGWKTDRGMIYIVLGAPHIVYKNISNETWIYGNEKSFNSISFTFEKVNNPFTDNDYELIRLPMYANYWFVNIDTWRR